MSSEPKLTRRERERIIFDYLKGQPNPLYEVKETSNGKYVVSQKKIEIEEEERPEPAPARTPEPKLTKQQIKRERRKQNRRAKADAYRILEQLNRLLNTNDEEPIGEITSDDEEPADVGYDQPKAPQLVDQPQFQNQQLSFRRKRLRF